MHPYLIWADQVYTNRILDKYRTIDSPNIRERNYIYGFFMNNIIWIYDIHAIMGWRKHHHRSLGWDDLLNQNPLFWILHYSNLNMFLNVRCEWCHVMGVGFMGYMEGATHSCRHFIWCGRWRWHPPPPFISQPSPLAIFPFPMELMVPDFSKSSWT